MSQPLGDSGLPCEMIENLSFPLIPDGSNKAPKHAA
jgi:hypothetical protein